MRVILLLFAMMLSAGAGDAVESAVPGTMSPATKKLYDNWQALKSRKLRLLPVPKNISFAGAPVTLDKIAVVIEGVKDKSAEIAANELVSRVRELSGHEIPVLNVVQAGKYNLVIESRYPNFFTEMEKDKVLTQNPFCRKQAYGVKVFENGLRMAGNSPLAAIYAAVTVRYLMEGKLLHPAEVIDWPDFPRRLLTDFLAPYHYKYKNYPEKHLQNMKKYVDWALRLKCNMVFGQTYRPFYKLTSPLNKNKMANENLYRSGSAVGKYMKERGISALAGIDVALGYDTDKDKPEVKDMFYNRIHKKYYSWANSKLHNMKAGKSAETFSKLGYGSVFIHSIDGGALSDPEYWSKRDKLTRDKYGDDRVQADADMFSIYIDLMKKHGLEPQLVVYPYTASDLDIDASLKSLGLSNTPANRSMVKDQIEKLDKFMHELNNKIPKDVPVCVRESKPEFMRRFYNNYKGRPMLIYYEVMHPARNTYPLLPQEINTFITAYDPRRKQNDIIWLNMHRKLLEQASVCGAEYAWNTQFPGSSVLDRSRNPVNYDTAVLDIMAERAAVGLWGNELGQGLKNLFNRQLSFNLAYSPEDAVARMNLKSLVPILHKNYIAAIEAEKSMDEAWKKLKKNKKLLRGFSYQLFITYYKMLKAARAYTAVNYYAALGYEYAGKGDMKSVENSVKHARKELALTTKEYSRTLKELENEPEIMTFDDVKGWWSMPPVNMDSNLLNPDFRALEKKLAELDKNKAETFLRYNVPSWFKKFIKGKSLAALRVREAIKIDGKLDENAWNSSVPVEYFINSKSLRIPAHPVVMRLLYDDNKLYLGGRISQPLMDKIKYSGNGQCDFSESIEFFIQPDIKNKAEYFQFALDAWGHLFALKKGGAGLNVSKNINWDSGAEFGSVRNSQGWSFELTIPLNKLGNRADMSALACYNGIEELVPRKIVESYASNNVEGGGFHNPDKFQRLRFVTKPLAVAANVNLLCKNVSIKGVTHESGTGSLVKFDAVIETRRPLYDLEITARFLDKNKKPVGGQMLVLKKNYLALSWRSSTLLNKQLLKDYSGIYIQLTAKYKDLEGNEGIVVKEFTAGNRDYLLKKGNPYKEGLAKGTKGIGCPFYFDTVAGAEKFLSPDKGTIELWVKPEFKVYNRALSPNERLVLFHCGLIRPKYPTNFNKSSIFAMFVPAYGSINFQIANEKYKARNTYAYIRNWKKGQWHHFAFVWDLENESCRMDIYIDGKLSSSSKDVKKLIDKSLDYPIQFGAMNSGYWSFHGTIDELKISRDTEYKKGFTPTEKANGKGIIFHFEGKLKSTGDKEIEACDGILKK